MSFERTIGKSGILKKEGASVGKCLLSRHPGPVFHPQHYETKARTSTPKVDRKLAPTERCVV
ncbi:rCG51555 [Rattus norvegicus]|uniref:RCG51555 n=1 Tax=Rattus norvegicus TaxID=10116 RepID=A6IYW7_RAT|nr:rCG51555 [Rattus norvegicus]